VRYCEARFCGIARPRALLCRITRWPRRRVLTNGSWDVRFCEQTGSHLLTARLTGFDPELPISGTNSLMQTRIPACARALPLAHAVRASETRGS